MDRSRWWRRRLTLIVLLGALGLPCITPPSITAQGGALVDDIDLTRDDVTGPSGRHIRNIYQRDPRWANARVGPGDDRKRRTMSACGCYLSAVAAVMNYMLQAEPLFLLD